MRVFLAIEPSPDERRAIADWRDRHAPAPGRAIPAGNFHVTLAFLGEFGQSRIDTLCERVDEEALALSPSFSPPPPLHLNQVAYRAKLGIYWLGSGEKPPALDTLARRLQQLGTRLGAKRDRHPFTPHVSLYRGCELPPGAPDLPPDIRLLCDNITLFESRRGRSGASYHALEQWPLPVRHSG
jgi:2'-5' RNA ligase